jgi:hypothetical protein
MWRQPHLRAQEVEEPVQRMWWQSDLRAWEAEEPVQRMRAGLVCTWAPQEPL